MPDDIVLPPLQRRIFELLQENVGTVVGYTAFESVICCRDSRNLLAQAIRRLRNRGLKIENISGVGYRLKQRRKSPVHMVEMSEYDQAFASDIQDAISDVMNSHARTVGLESQLAIMAISIGSFLGQLPDPDCRHFTNVFLRNFNEAPNLSEPMQMQ